MIHSILTQLFDLIDRLRISNKLKIKRQAVGNQSRHISPSPPHIAICEICGFNRAELGYWIGKGYWNRGYCTEAANAMIGYGFRELGLNKIIACHITRNPASGMVMQKIEMKREALFREHAIKWGKYEDVAYYGILRKEWGANV